MPSYGDRVPVSYDLEITSCSVCAVLFAVPKKHLDACRESGAKFYCPNGHMLSWDVTSQLREAQNKLAAKEAYLQTVLKERAQAKADLLPLQAVDTKRQIELIALREAKVTLTKANELLVAAVKKLEGELDKAREECVRLRTPRILANGELSSRWSTLLTPG